MCASDDAIRKIMLAAHELKMTNGEYAFINIKLFDSNYFGNNKLVWHREGDSDEENEKAKQAFRALMTFTLRKPNTPQYDEFALEVKQRAKKYYDFDFDAVNETVSFETRGSYVMLISCKRRLARLCANRKRTLGAKTSCRVMQG